MPAGLFGTDISSHFRDLPDGRTVFLPAGPRGPAYEIRDWQVRDRIERWYKALAILKIAITAVIVPLVFRDASRWWWVLGLAVPYVIEWRIWRAVTDGLNEVHEYRLLDAERERKKGTETWSGGYRPERWESSESSPSRRSLAQRARSLLRGRELS